MLSELTPNIFYLLNIFSQCTKFEVINNPNFHTRQCAIILS